MSPEGTAIGLNIDLLHLLQSVVEELDNNEFDFIQAIGSLKGKMMGDVLPRISMLKTDVEELRRGNLQVHVLQMKLDEVEMVKSQNTALWQTVKELTGRIEELEKEKVTS